MGASDVPRSSLRSRARPVRDVAVSQKRACGSWRRSSRSSGGTAAASPSDAACTHA
jgi:hypothetical protein